MLASLLKQRKDYQVVSCRCHFTYLTLYDPYRIMFQKSKLTTLLRDSILVQQTREVSSPILYQLQRFTIKNETLSFEWEESFTFKTLSSSHGELVLHRELCFSELLKNKMVVVGKQIQDFFPASFCKEVLSQMSAPAYILKYKYINPFPKGYI